MKEYSYDNGKDIDMHTLTAQPMDDSSYMHVHLSLPIICHDIFIEYKKGILLVRRRDFPGKGGYFPVGGRVLRGVSVEESIRKKAAEECGLHVTGIREMGIARTVFKTDPFGHGKGTDTFNIVYFGEGSGDLNLDAHHSEIMIINKAAFTKEFESLLHPYVADYLKVALSLLSDEN